MPTDPSYVISAGFLICSAKLLIGSEPIFGLAGRPYLIGPRVLLPPDLEFDTKPEGMAEHATCLALMAGTPSSMWRRAATVLLD